MVAIPDMAGRWTAQPQYADQKRCGHWLNTRTKDRTAPVTTVLKTAPRGVGHHHCRGKPDRALRRDDFPGVAGPGTR